MNGGGSSGRLRVAGPDRLVDRGVFADRLFRVAADGAV